MRVIGHWSGGKPVEGVSGRSGPVFDPASGEQKAEVAFASPDEVDAAVRAASEAFEQWSGASISTRAKTLFAFRELVNAHVEELAAIVSDEHGKVITDARGEVQRGLEVVEFACGIPQLLKGEYSDQVSTGVDMFSYRQPLGVVCGITPFNFPVMVPMWMHPIAIACGNTFVLKPSERDPSASMLIAELWARSRLARRGVQRSERRQGGGRRPPRSSGDRGRLLRRLDPDRTVRPLARDGGGQAWPRRSAGPRTTPWSCRMPTSTLPPTTWWRPPSGQPEKGAWPSRPPWSWVGPGDALVDVLRDKASGIRVVPVVTSRARWAR